MTADPFSGGGAPEWIRCTDETFYFLCSPKIAAALEPRQIDILAYIKNKKWPERDRRRKRCRS